MKGEVDWVRWLCSSIQPCLANDGLSIECGKRLLYTAQVAGYRVLSNGDVEEPVFDKGTSYQTDVLVGEQTDDRWVPRLVVECKKGQVTTHDALTYSTKAASHKTVHPSLRYGLLLGDFADPLPKRLLRHGHNFDFMIAVPNEDVSAEHLNQIVQLVLAEVAASRKIGDILSGKQKVRFLHRGLETSL
ncbi:MAG: hypothetical protein SGJ07_06435 [Rhodospirillaceae bacterium]|nr:hypothetical protein [Rhodospirillaceae bacterium]